MSNLKKIQQNFADHIFNKKDGKILQTIPYAKQEALARLNIYRNNVLGAFESVLDNIYPVTKNILGEKEFFSYVKKYCQKFDSKSGNLDEYGEFFPKLFLKHKLKYFYDLTTVELTYYRAYFSAEIKQEFDVEKFKKIAADDFFTLTFDLHPSMVLFKSKHPVHSIWHDIKPALEPEFLAIYRHFNEVSLLKITPEEFLFLEDIKKGKKLYAIYQKIYKKLGRDFDIGVMINRFIEKRVIVGFHNE